MSQAIYYKYRQFSDLTLKSLCNDQVFFSSLDKFNDPFDCNPEIILDIEVKELEELLFELIKTKSEIAILNKLQSAGVTKEKAQNFATKQSLKNAANAISYSEYMASDPDNINPEDAHRHHIFYRIKDEIGKNYQKGVFCLSTTPLSMLLWSHYGGEHTGLCIGYSTDRNPKPDIKKVNYTNDRRINTSLIYDAIVQKSEEEKVTLDELILLRKSKEWKYEDEYRLIDRSGLMDSPFLLTDVTFGMRCDISIMHVIMQALAGRENPVQYYSASPAPGKCNLRRKKITPDDLREYVPRTARSANEEFNLLVN